jgi:predicted ester cyclase
VTIRRVVAQDDLVAVHLVGSGTHRGGCFSAAQRLVALGGRPCTALYRIGDGRITPAWVNWDLLAAMEQIGCIERAATASA